MIKPVFISILFILSLPTLSQVRTGGGDVSDYDKPYGYPDELDTIDHPLIKESHVEEEKVVIRFNRFLISRINKCYRNGSDLISPKDNIISLYIKLQQLSLNLKHTDSCSDEMKAVFNCITGTGYYDGLKVILLNPQSRIYFSNKYSLSLQEVSRVLKFYYHLNEVCKNKKMLCNETDSF